jgi:parallel beta-helix repeat protein
MKKIIILIGLICLIGPIGIVHATTIIDGDLVKTANSPDVYIIKIINGEQYKRLILNPEIFNQYGHLKWSNIKTISQTEIGGYVVSNVVRANDDERVYYLTPSGDTGIKHWIKTADDFIGLGFKWNEIYTINNFERDFYIIGPDLEMPKNTEQPVTPTPPTSRTVPTTLHVPGDYSTIQAAINASIDGDTISIGSGTYNENIVIDRNINLVSNYATGIIINGNGTDNAITIKGGKDVLIQRFTIKSKDKYGIYCESGSFTIKNNIINDSGWGIVVADNCRATILNNLIYNNKKSDNTDGAGILVKDNSTYDITTEIRNNVITDNYHGIWSENSSTKVLNNIISKNIGGGGSVESVGIYHSGAGKSDNYYNDAWSNGWNYRGDALAGNGSLDINPKFVNESQKDYRLQTGSSDYSPCIDTGYPDYVYNDGTLMTTSNYRNDMGAYGGPDNIGWTP